MKKNYKVSVVTPFHNVSIPMFEKCVAGMRAQTIGFENVEWIIVLHNCDKGYRETLSAMFEADANVMLKELNNEACTPSSPRNYGTGFATAPYVGYLDGDDIYLPSCLEVTLREAIETGSDIVWFRREVEKESPELVLAMPITIWNNTSERILIDRGNWDDERMFDGSFGYATTFIYRTQFLRQAGLAFDETMLFAEDFLFVVQVCAKASRICYLPQFIGYRYFVNSGSLVQSGNKDARTLLSYAEGFRLLFDTMRSYGIDDAQHILGLCSVMARFILSSPSLTAEDRQRIKGILSPYILTVRQFSPTKTFDAGTLQNMWLIVHDVILNPENPGVEYLRSTTNGVAELRSILHRNAATDIGRRYHFDRLDSVQAYRNRLPLADMSTYRPLIQLQTKVGEYGILSADSIVRYLASSDGELLPMTRLHARRYADCLAATLRGRKNILLALSHPALMQTNDGAVVDTLNSSVVKDYFCQCHFSGGMPQAVLSSPVERYFSAAGDDDFFALMTDALSASDAEQLVAFTAKDLLAALNTLEDRWPDMVECMAEGKRRDEVRRVLSAGFDTPIAARLWPGLKRVVCYGAGKMSRSMQQLRRYIGELPHNHGYDFLKTTVMGKAVADDSDIFECMKDNNFFEFLPVDSQAGNQQAPASGLWAGQSTLLWSELEAGKPYQVVVTNSSGLYRYLTGHFICPQRVTPESIQFTILSM